MVGRVVDADAGSLGAQPGEDLIAAGRDADDAVERDSAVNVHVDQGDAVEPVESFPVGVPQPLAAPGGFGEAGELGAADGRVDGREVGAQPEGLDGVAVGQLFSGWDILPPGITGAGGWRAGRHKPGRVICYAGVARKP